MLATLRSLRGWDISLLSEKQDIVWIVERGLEPLMGFHALEMHSLGGQEHTIAMFSHGGARFALLPGYTGQLGYDPAVHPRPPDASSEHAAEVDASMIVKVGEVFRKALTPLRSVSLPPFLWEVSPTPLEKIEQQPDGTWMLLDPIERSEVVASVAQEGFRLPTSDEWEYACSGGSRGLFRWSNEWPPIRWTPSRLRGAGEWNEDLKPNAFGLNIGQDPHRLEYCGEPGVVRGGDGGSASHSEAGFYAEWLALATSFCFPYGQDLVERGLRRPYFRRALSLPDALLA